VYKGLLGLFIINFFLVINGFIKGNLIFFIN
jgi:hypothetical protein